MTNRAKIWLAAIVTGLCVTLLLGVLLRRPSFGPTTEPERATAASATRPPANREAVTPSSPAGSATSGQEPASVSGTASSPGAEATTAGETHSEATARRGASTTSGAPELAYVPASEAAPAVMMSDGFQHQAGATNPDLMAVAGTVRDYRAALGENPVGNNAEITRALLGDNARHAQFLAADARTNDAGELLDRWGHPYFFHQISRTEMEIHSAGPDGVMWDADDQVSR